MFKHVPKRKIFNKDKVIDHRYLNGLAVAD